MRTKRKKQGRPVNLASVAQVKQTYRLLANEAGINIMGRPTKVVVESEPINMFDDIMFEERVKLVIIKLLGV